MKKTSYVDRLKLAAVEGVIMRLEQHQLFYVVSFLDKCTVPEAVFESRKIRELSLAYLNEGFDHFFIDRDEKMKMVANLMKLVRVPESEVHKTILGYFARHVTSYKRLPHNFEMILEEFPVPVSELNKNRNLQKAAMVEISSGTTGILFQRQRCFLKYFSVSLEDTNSMVRRALSHFAYEQDNESQLDEFIKATGFNRGQILSLLTEVISDLISDGYLEEVEVLAKKFVLPSSMIVNDENKKMAVSGVLSRFDNGQIEEANRVLSLFALSNADFKRKELLGAIEDALCYHQFEDVDNIIAFADLPCEVVTILIHSKLKDLVLLETEKLRPFTEKYGIDWSEVVSAAKEDFIEGLACSGDKYLKSYIDKYGFSKEFLASERVVNAAKEGLINLYRYADHNNSITFLVETFGLS